MLPLMLGKPRLPSLFYPINPQTLHYEILVSAVYAFISAGQHKFPIPDTET